MPISKAWATKTTWSVGPTNATAAKITPPRAVMYPRTPSDMKISTKMADGATHRITAPSGSRIPRWWAGLLTATAIGPGLILGATPGSMTSLGASRLSTMAAGLRLAARGVGYLAGQQQWLALDISVLSPLPPWSLGLAEAALPWEWLQAAALRWAGSPSDRVKCMFRPIARAAPT